MKIFKPLTAAFFRISLFCFLMPGICTSASANMSAPAPKVYVDNFIGNDSTGTGSISLPWKTITRALLTVNAVPPGLHYDIHIVDTGITYSSSTGESFPLMIRRPDVTLTSSSAGTRPWIVGDPGKAVLKVTGGPTGTTRVRVVGINIGGRNSTTMVSAGIVLKAFDTPALNTDVFWSAIEDCEFRYCSSAIYSKPEGPLPGSAQFGVSSYREGKAAVDANNLVIRDCNFAFHIDHSQRGSFEVLGDGALVESGTQGYRVSPGQYIPEHTHSFNYKNFIIRDSDHHAIRIVGGQGFNLRVVLNAEIRNAGISGSGDGLYINTGSNNSGNGFATRNADIRLDGCFIKESSDNAVNINTHLDFENSVNVYVANSLFAGNGKSGISMNHQGFLDPLKLKLEMYGCTIADNLNYGVNNTGMQPAPTNIFNTILAFNLLGENYSMNTSFGNCLSDNLALPPVANNFVGDPGFGGATGYYVDPLGPANGNGEMTFMWLPFGASNTMKLWLDINDFNRDLNFERDIGAFEED